MKLTKARAEDISISNRYRHRTRGSVRQQVLKSKGGSLNSRIFRLEYYPIKKYYYTTKNKRGKISPQQQKRRSNMFRVYDKSNNWLRDLWLNEV